MPPITGVTALDPSVGSPSRPAAAEEQAATVFPGTGEMAGRCRTFDWAATPLGPVRAWPQSLRTTAATVLATGFPCIVLWGPDLIQLYNDAYAPILAAKHPWGLGLPTRECWPEAWAFNEPIYRRVFQGETVTLENQLYRLARHGTDVDFDDLYLTISYSPVRDESGGVGGVFITILDTSAQVERDRLYHELAVERGRLASVFQQAPAFLAVLRGERHVFELANVAYYQLVGHRDILGKPVFEALPDVRGQGFEELLDGVLTSGEPFVGRELPLVVQRTPGAPPEQRYVDLIYMPLVEADGSRTGIIAHGTDVTEHVLARREVERLLTESEHTGRALAIANEQLEEQQVEVELTNRRLQENAVELEMQAEELQAATAELEERTAEVEAERQRLTRVLDRLPVGVIVVDARGKVISRNAALETVLGHTPHQAADVDGYAAYGGLHPDGRPYAPHEYPIARTVLRGETVLRELTRYRRGDGSIVTLSISAAPVRDESGVVEYAVATIEDVNDREAARAAAEEANRAKSQFLANMSHELRTPLNAIQGHLQLLAMDLHGPLVPQQRETVGRIDRAQKHLQGLINDILGYARLESGRVEYDVQPILVTEVLRDVLPIVEPLLLAKGLTLSTRLPEQLGAEPIPVWADQEKLGQVVLNLVSNAVKFTPTGGQVIVELTDRPDPGAGGAPGSSEVAYLHVRDTGIGIPSDKLEAVFEPFVQVRSIYAPGQGGTGLGLAISRDLARGMGGDLRARSVEGEGSTFTTTLRRVVRPTGEPIDRRTHEERRIEEERRLSEDQRRQC